MDKPLPPATRYEIASLRIAAMGVLKGWGDVGQNGKWREWNRGELETKAAEVTEWALGNSALRCHFCGKSTAEVKKLIAGPNSLICDECVGLCVEIIAGKASPATEPPTDQ